MIDGEGAKSPGSDVARLAPQQRACLEGVWHLQSSKEIARRLGISKSTVDGYLAEAVRTLGARNRRDAAMRCFGPPPINSGDIETRVVPDQPDDDPAVAGQPDRIPWWARIEWPVRTSRRPHNDLSAAAILIWIVIIATLSLVVLGLVISLANGLATAFPPASGLAP